MKKKKLCTSLRKCCKDERDNCASLDVLCGKHLFGKICSSQDYRISELQNHRLKERLLVHVLKCGYNFLMISSL